MPPQLALLLCSTFVLWLLQRERRRAPESNATLWIPTLWMLAIASKPLGIWFGMSGDAEAGSPLDRFLLIGLGVAGLLVLRRRRFDWAHAFQENRWLAVLLGYMLLSTLWSDITFIAIKRWVRMAIAPVMALVILSEPQPRDALESILRRSIYILVPFSALLVKYFPAFGIEYGRWSGVQMWVGVTLHKNSLGRLCLIAAGFLLWAIHRRWQDRESTGDWWMNVADTTALLLAVWLLKGAEEAYSATSIGTLAVGLVAFLILAGIRKLRLMLPKVVLLALVTFLIAFGMSTPFVGGSNVASVSLSFGREETLTGRTDTWQELVPLFRSQPVLGVGFGSFWTSARRDFYQMSHGHNGFLDILLELGVLGMACYAAWLLSCSHRLHAALDRDYLWGSLGICFLLMMLVYNISESALSSLAEQMTAVVVLVTVVVCAPSTTENADKPRVPATPPATPVRGLQP